MPSQFPYPIVSLAIKDYLLSLINPFNVLNTVSGTTSGTLNKKSGIIDVTQFLTAGQTGIFTLTNSYAYLTPQKSVVQYSLWYSGAGTPVITSYLTTNGTVVFAIKNIDATTTLNAHLFIQYRIIA